MMTENPGPYAASKLITAILPRGQAADLIQALKDEWGLQAANFNSARGVGRITPLRERGFGEQSEKDILSIVVATEQADEIFADLYWRAGLDQPHGGLMYMAALGRATRFTLPAVDDET